MAKEFNLKDYTEYNITPLLSYDQSLLNEFDFSDTIQTDQTYEGWAGVNMLWYAAAIKKKTFLDPAPGIWMGVDKDGLAKLNVGVGDDTTPGNHLIWDGTNLLIYGNTIIISGTTTWSGTPYYAQAGSGGFFILESATNFSVASLTSAGLNLYISNVVRGNVTATTIAGQNGLLLTGTDFIALTAPVVAASGILGAVGVVAAKTATAATAGGVGAISIGNSGTFGIYWGSGVPTVGAAKGSLYLRTDGVDGVTRAYIADSASTWTAILTLT